MLEIYVLGDRYIRKIEVNGLNIELNDEIYNKMNILKAEYSIKEGKDLDWSDFFNLLFPGLILILF